MYCHSRPISVCFGSNIVPWKEQTGVFTLRMQCNGRHRPVCLRLECSVMGGTDLCVYTNNEVPWEPQTDVFTLRI